MTDVPAADWLALGVIALFAIVSMTRGVIAEAAALVTWIVAFMAAKMLAVPFAGVAFASVEPQALGVAMAFVMVFFGAWLVQRLLRSLLTSAVSAVGLGGINRLFGGVFGVLKAVLLLTVAVMVCSFTDLPQTPEWQESYSIPYFQLLAETALPYLREQEFDLIP